jgi:hypothetical protein
MGADRLEDRARLVARTGLKFTAYSFEDDLTDAILRLAEAHISSGGIEDDIFFKVKLLVHTSQHRLIPTVGANLSTLR